MTSLHKHKVPLLEDLPLSNTNWAEWTFNSHSCMHHFLQPITWNRYHAHSKQLNVMGFAGTLRAHIPNSQSQAPTVDVPSPSNTRTPKRNVYSKFPSSNSHTCVVDSTVSSKHHCHPAKKHQAHLETAPNWLTTSLLKPKVLLLTPGAREYKLKRGLPKYPAPLAKKNYTILRCLVNCAHIIKKF